MNPSFDTGLDGWQQDVSEAEVLGTIEPLAGRAVLSENDSFVTHLEQLFVVPKGMVELSFDVEMLAGFEVDEGGIPDVFEARLVDASGATVVKTSFGDGTSFFNLQQNGDVHLATGVSFDGTRVTLDTTDVPEGSVVRLMFSLVGADAGATSAVAVDSVDMLILNTAPVADAGPDETFECGVELVELDGRGSFDLDGDRLFYAWRDEDDELVEDAAVARFDSSVGVSTYTLTVDDGRGLSASDDIVVTVEDTTPPEFLQAIDPIHIDEAGVCAGLVPDLSAVALAEDACSDVTITQLPAPGEALALGVPTTVSVTATDATGLSSTLEVVVTVVDPDDSCNRPPVADAGLDRTLSCGVDAAVLDGTASYDPDGDALAYLWTDGQGALVGQTAVVPLDLGEGVHAFSLFVDDGRGASDADDVVLTVVDDAPPTLADLPDQEVDEAGQCGGQLPDLTLLANASDTCSDVTVVQSPLPGLAMALNGPVTVTLTATDASGQSSAIDVVVTVVDPDDSCDQAPVADAGPDQDLECGASVVLDGSGSFDPDGDPLGYLWSDAFGGTVGVDATVSVDLGVGVHGFELTVDDGRGKSGSDDVVVTVTDGRSGVGCACSRGLDRRGRHLRRLGARPDPRCGLHRRL